MGVTPTNDPAWTAFASTPNINDYTLYSRYGYAFAQNMVANAILQETTNEDKASISSMNVPL